MNKASDAPLPVVEIGRDRLRLEDVVAISTRSAQTVLCEDPAFRARIARGAEFVDRLIAEDGVVYGVSTGYGDSCTVTIPPELISELPRHLYTYHGCGLATFAASATLTAATTTPKPATSFTAISASCFRSTSILANSKP